MNSKNENPQLLAVVKIRNLVSSTVDDLNKIKAIGREIDLLTNKAIAIIADFADQKLADQWSQKITSYNDNVSALKEIMTQAMGKIEKRDASGASEIWASSSKYSHQVLEIMEDMKTSGLSVIQEEKKNQWMTIWNDAADKFDSLSRFVQNSELKLQMIESFTPEEVDELTDEILQHMPKNYSEQEAEKYEEEYVTAYNEIKASTAKKKGLWDRFLDLLAGGTQQSPAEKVMMQRWVNGEKEQ